MFIENCPNQKYMSNQKTVLITGCTNGIGKVTALELARDGHRVVMANRNRSKAEQLRDEIAAATGNENLELLDLDLASLASVRDCAAAFLQSHGTLDILVNNAGLMSNDEVITEDGFELQFAVNGLSQFLFTLQLLPALEAAAPSQSRCSCATSPIWRSASAIL